METHGADVVESLLPILVWVLEGLASCRAQLRESEDAMEKEKGEREVLLERYERERTLRRESQEVSSLLKPFCLFSLVSIYSVYNQDIFKESSMHFEFPYLPGSAIWS